MKKVFDNQITIAFIVIIMTMTITHPKTLFMIFLSRIRIKVFIRKIKGKLKKEKDELHHLLVLILMSAIKNNKKYYSNNYNKKCCKIFKIEKTFKIFCSK